VWKVGKRGGRGGEEKEKDGRKRGGSRKKVEREGGRGVSWEERISGKGRGCR